MLRKLILVAASSAAFGAVAGVLATAAVQSQASPQAIAAAVQRVQDARAEQTLRTIDGDLRALPANDQRAFTNAMGGRNLGVVLSNLEHNLYAICRASGPGCQYPGP